VLRCFRERLLGGAAARRTLHAFARASLPIFPHAKLARR
jgi:hypothetical protein